MLKDLIILRTVVLEVARMDGMDEVEEDGVGLHGGEFVDGGLTHVATDDAAFFPRTEIGIAGVFFSQ
jgi:hypothetical protein